MHDSLKNSIFRFIYIFMNFQTLLLCSLFLVSIPSLSSCQSNTSTEKSVVSPVVAKASTTSTVSNRDGYNPKYIDSTGSTIEKRFISPDGYARKRFATNEFGYFLRQLPLKEMGSLVHYYNGSKKSPKQIYVSVIDLPIGNRDLHQCADAVMRLRADYLYQQKRYPEIQFNFLSDGKPRRYLDYSKGDYSRAKYWKYMEYIFAYANSSSLHDELPVVAAVKDIRIGDTFIQKGNPIGHAVIVVDLVENEAGEKLVLLAQSYMPAQEIQVLNNPNDRNLSPWYKLDEEPLLTPEWSFVSDNLRTWKNR